MEKEINGINDYKNDETNQSIVANNYISGIDGYDFKFLYYMNLEENRNSFPKKDYSRFIEFPHNFELLKDDEIFEKYLNFLRGEKNSTNQNKNVISKSI